MLNRSQHPEFHTIEAIELTPINSQQLTNQQTCYLINTGQQNTIKLEVVFRAGSLYENKKGVGGIYTKLFLGGTKQYSATDLAEIFSQYGGFTEVSQTSERLTFTLFGLNDYLEKFLPIIKQIIEETQLSEEELLIQKQIAIQQLQINLEKTAYVANQQFRNLLFGADNPMGYIIQEEDIEAITLTDIATFYEENVRNRPFQLFLSGSFEEKHIEQINRYLGSIEIKSASPKSDEKQLFQNSTQVFLLEKPESVQSSIRIGKFLFSRKHPDYFPFLVTNMLLGGYFGSRLMKNIREEKGFTYGISSSLVPLKNTGYFMVGTDVKKEFTQQTIDEIKKEMATLQSTLVSENELQTVKNYMAGQLAGSINTPFDIADKQKVIVFEELSAKFYDNFISKIREVTSQQVQEIAQKYFSYDSMIEVVVGGK